MFVGPSRASIRCFTFNSLVCFIQMAQKTLCPSIFSRWACIPSSQPLFVFVESHSITMQDSVAPYFSTISYRHSAHFLAGLSGWTDGSGVKCDRYLAAGSQVTLTCSWLTILGCSLTAKLYSNPFFLHTQYHQYLLPSISSPLSAVLQPWHYLWLCGTC